MYNYNEATREVYNELEEIVGRLYSYFERNLILKMPDGTVMSTEEKFDEMFKRRYISSSYIVDFQLLVDYKVRKAISEYNLLKSKFETRINTFLEMF